MAECQIRLHRDSLGTPWGFRLQGGKDFKAPLKVQRVFVGSPAEGELQRGDVILSIDNYDVTQMVHNRAMDLIKQAGGGLSLRIRRAPGVRPIQTSAPGPRPALSAASQHRMLNSLSHSLGDAVVNKAVQQHSPTRPYTYSAKPIWQRPKDNLAGALPEPGWTPKAKSGAWSPVKAPEAAKFRPHVPQAAPPPRPVNARPIVEPEHTEPSRPAWMGSLKSSGGPKPWEMREAENIAGPGALAQSHPAPTQQQQPPKAQQALTPPPVQNIQPHQPRLQNVHYGPGGAAPTYSQHDGASAQDDHNSAQVKHLQYNSPLGLYSRENVEAALSGQTTGKPGQGTMQVSGGGPPKSFDPQRSDVYKMLQEEEKGRMQKVSARYQDPNAHGEMNYQGFVDHSVKSPAMGRLEQHVADLSLGTSDF